MNIDQRYDQYKQYLKSLNLSYNEYEAKIKEWCEKNKY